MSVLKDRFFSKKGISEDTVKEIAKKLLPAGTYELPAIRGLVKTLTPNGAQYVLTFPFNIGSVPGLTITCTRIRLAGTTATLVQNPDITIIGNTILVKTTDSNFVNSTTEQAMINTTVSYS